jgi:hypothetical protein
MPEGHSGRSSGLDKLIVLLPALCANLDFDKIKKTALQQFPISTPNLSIQLHGNIHALINRPIGRQKDVGKNKIKERILQMFKTERKHKSD